MKGKTIEKKYITIIPSVLFAGAGKSRLSDTGKTLTWWLLEIIDGPANAEFSGKNCIIGWATWTWLPSTIILLSPNVDDGPANGGLTSIYSTACFVEQN